MSVTITLLAKGVSFSASILRQIAKGVSPLDSRGFRGCANDEMQRHRDLGSCRAYREGRSSYLRCTGDIKDLLRSCWHRDSCNGDEKRLTRCTYCAAQTPHIVVTLGAECQPVVATVRRLASTQVPCSSAICRKRVSTAVAASYLLQRFGIAHGR